MREIVTDEEATIDIGTIETTIEGETREIEVETKIENGTETTDEETIDEITSEIGTTEVVAAVDETMETEETATAKDETEMIKRMIVTDLGFKEEEVEEVAEVAQEDG